MDTKEYERLVSLYLGSIYRVALNGCSCSVDAEDVVQNTFVKLWERQEAFPEDDYARKWLIRVAVNECKSLWRTAWKRKTTYLEEAEREPVFSAPEKSDLYYAVPEGLAEKVGRINEGDVKYRRNVVGCVMRKVAIAAAILVALFAGSNGIAYAMTGETWVEKIILRRNIDGVEYEVEAEARELRNGETVYVGEIELEDGKKASFLEHDGEGPTMYLPLEEGAEICSYAGRTYILDGDLELDITEDYADDSHASGSYVVNGVYKEYCLWIMEDGRLACSVYSPPKEYWPEDMRE